MKAINRYNYEEFFLLYIDGELDAEQKGAVEQFVEQNADLSVELDMLMQTKAMPEEEIVFTSKENLIRTEGNGINETNYEEYFLLYIDDELSAAKRQEVETYILQHPRLQDEFILLKHAVLQPEIVSYSNKEELYRRESRRVVTFKPWRLAAAAIFIGLLAVGGWLLEKAPSTNTVADVHKVIEQPKQNPQPADQGLPQQEIKQPKVTVEQAAPAINKPKQAMAARKNVKPDQGKHVDDFKDELAYQQTVPPKNEAQNNDIVKHEQPDIADNDITKEPVADNTITESPQVAENIEADNSSYTIYPVSYKVINTDDEDQSVHVAVLDLNKNKVKGFLKKAGRLFNNKSNDLANKGGKLQVANFQIETNKQ